MLSEFAENIWIADGPEVSVLGFNYPTRMTVIRLKDGLFIWSPVALSEDLKSQVDALGIVRWVIAPNNLHHLFLTDWHTAYPDAQLWAAPRLPSKRKDLSFHAVLSDTPSPEWAQDIEQVCIKGNAITEEVVFFHKPSGTVLFTDLLQQFPKGYHTGWRGIVAKLDKMVEPEPAVPRKFRMAFFNRNAARESLGKVLAWPSERVILAHGRPVQQHGKTFLATAFTWLFG